MKAKLIVLNSHTGKRTFTLSRFPAIIGRANEADVHIDDSCVSRRQCVIDKDDDGTLVIRDLHSRNGTFVNGVEIESCQVLPGDELLIGQTFFRVDYSRHNLRGKWFGKLFRSDRSDSPDIADSQGVCQRQKNDRAALLPWLCSSNDSSHSDIQESVVR